MKKTLLTLLVLLACNLVQAQDNIYPKPHKVTTLSQGATTSIKDGVNIYNSNVIDKPTLEALLELTTDSKNGIKTYIATPGSKAAKKIKASNISLPQTPGAYYLRIDDKKISILGYDDNGTFYAIQTLRQLIGKDGTIPQVEIIDYPDIAFRGVVEGFYGKPWSHRDRISQMEFYGRNKLNTYIYGPKDDPYHSSLSDHSTSTNTNQQGGWRVPYPEAEGAKIKELAEVAKANKVNFVWAIHPGQDIKWNDEDFNLLINKFEKMYELGVRSYAVFFDDISGVGTDAHKQAELLNKINEIFVKAKGDVTPLIMCPTEYNKLWANPEPDGYLPILGRELDPSVQIMWTGDKVCADITMSTLNWVNKRINRPSYIWWNFPVTDYVRHLLVQGPSYGLDTKATSNDMIGFTSNPMEYAEASKVALFGVADYTWNIAEYDHIKCWNAAFDEILPEASEAYRTFAIHSCDLEDNWHQYRREESWETKVIDPTNYTEEDFNALNEEFIKIYNAPQTINIHGKNRYLIEEMKPWLIEFEKLGRRGIETMKLIKTLDKGDNSAIWSQLIRTEMSSSGAQSYRDHKSGTKVLQPFIDNTRKSVINSLTKDIYGLETLEPAPIVYTSFKSKIMLDNVIDSDVHSYYDANRPALEDSYVALDLHKETEITSLIIKQGREDGDLYYFPKGVVEYSLDNNEWSEILSFGDKNYTIEYFSQTPIKARYIRIRNKVKDSEKQLYFALRDFQVNKVNDKPTILTNMGNMSKVAVQSIDNKVFINPIFEIITMNSGDYLGIELPLATQLSDASFDLNNKYANIEYSLDAKEWSTEKPETTRYIRVINRGKKSISIKIRKFELQTIIPTDIMLGFDKNLESGFWIDHNSDPVKVAVVSGAKRAIILSKGNIKVNGKSVPNYADIAIPQGCKELSIEGLAEIQEIIFK